MENHPEQTWAPRFKKLLLDMKKAKEDAMAMDLTSADEHKVQSYKMTAWSWDFTIHNIIQYHR